MDTTTTLLTGADVFKVLIGVSIGLIPALVLRYLDRKKIWNEQQEVSARTKLTLVNTRSVELRDDLAIGESVGEMLTTLIETGETIRDLQQQLFEFKGRTLRAEADAQAAQMFVEQLNAAAKLTTCEHHPNGVKLSNYAPQQLRKAMQVSEEEGEDSKPGDYH